MTPTALRSYLFTLLRVVCSYLTTYATAGSFALLFTLFLHVEKCQNVSKLVNLIEISAERKFFLYFHHLIIQNLNHTILTATFVNEIE